MEFYAIINGQQQGPFTIDELCRLGITPETEVWTEGMPDWQQAGDVAALTSLLQRLDYERHRLAQQSLAAAPTADAWDAPAAMPQAEPAPAPAPDAWDTPAPASTGGTPPPADAPRRRGCGLRSLIALLIVAIIATALVLTCPSRTQHKEAILATTKGWLNEKVEKAGMNVFAAEILKWVSGHGAELAVDQYLKVDNYFVCSVGSLTNGPRSTMVSVGVLGHVFTFSRGDIETALNDAMNKQVDDITTAVKNVVVPGADVTPDPYDESTLPDEDDQEAIEAIPEEPNSADDAIDELIDSLANRATEHLKREAENWLQRQVRKLGF